MSGGTRVPVGPGTVLTIDAMQWIEPCWEFDHPSAVLAPVIRTWETGQSIDGIVEDLCIDACVDGYVESEPIEDGVVARRWRVARLRRCFREALRGKEFPVMRYEAAQVHVRFYEDKQGDLCFEVLAAPPPGEERER